MSPPATTLRRTRIDASTVLVATLLVIAVVAVYLPWPALTGAKFVGGSDHTQLHARRMQFAHENLFGPAHRLPAWYPRELLGTPFRANLQNFPWIPTRLIVLASVDPEIALGIGAAMSAALAAIFTFLFCRRLGMGRIASAAGGWTFACCGFYASRVMAGHLPLLEAYPALPALLWLTDRAIDPAIWRATRRIDWSLIALGLTATCFALAGHPQLPVYALGFASLYALIARARQTRRGLIVIAAMALGVGTAAFALYPMALLTGRTTRVLPLERAENDLAMPVARLGAFLFPWKDGWPKHVQREPHVEFTGYSNDAFFWDTVVYMGWAPILALLVLAIHSIYQRAWPTRRAVVVALFGAVALLLALPMWQSIMSSLPGTFLRSPARLIYVVSFALAVAFAAAMHLLTIRRAAPWITLATVVLAVHAIDVSRHARAFIALFDRNHEPFPTEQFNGLLAGLRDGRMGFDYALNMPFNRAVDDIGFFDSIILAKPYRFVMDTSGHPEQTNIQAMDAAEMSPRTLRACGVRLVCTKTQRPDLVAIPPQPGAVPDVYTFGVRNAAPRCEFFSHAQVQFETENQIHVLLRIPTFSLRTRLLIPSDYRPVSIPPVQTSELAAEIRYSRPSSDEMIVNLTTNQPGYARLLESWDPGWQATVDGSPATVVPGDDVFVTVPVPEGKHELRLVYRTTGATAGAVVSWIAFALLIALGVAVAPGEAQQASRPA